MLTFRQKLFLDNAKKRWLTDEDAVKALWDYEKWSSSQSSNQSQQITSTIEKNKPFMPSITTKQSQISTPTTPTTPTIQTKVEQPENRWFISSAISPKENISNEEWIMSKLWSAVWKVTRWAVALIPKVAEWLWKIVYWTWQNIWEALTWQTVWSTDETSKMWLWSQLMWIWENIWEIATWKEVWSSSDRSKWIWAIVYWLWEKWMSALMWKETNKTVSSELADSIVNMYKERYWSVDWLLNAIQNEPDQVFFDVVWVLEGWSMLLKWTWKTTSALWKLTESEKISKAWEIINKISWKVNDLAVNLWKAPIEIPVKIAWKTIEWLWTWAKKLLWVTTWVWDDITRWLWVGEWLDTLAKQKKAVETFRGWLKWDITSEQIVGESQNALGWLKETRRQLYEDSFNKLKWATQKIDPLFLDKTMDSLFEKFNIKKDISETWQTRLEMRGSSLWTDSQKVVTNIVNDIEYYKKNPEELTPLWLDRLKQRIADEFIWGKKSDVFVQDINNNIKSAIKESLWDQAPIYEKMNSEYAKTSNDITQIQKQLSLWDKANVDTAFKKLTSTLRQNFEVRRDFLKVLQQNTDMDLLSAIAWVQSQDIIPKWLMGKLWGLWVWIWAWLFSPSMLSMMLVSSPRLVWSFLSTLWLWLNKARTVLEVIGWIGNKLKINPRSFYKQVANEDNKIWLAKLPKANDVNSEWSQFKPKITMEDLRQPKNIPIKDLGQVEWNIPVKWMTKNISIKDLWQVEWKVNVWLPRKTLKIEKPLEAIKNNREWITKEQFIKQHEEIKNARRLDEMKNISPETKKLFEEFKNKWKKEFIDKQQKYIYSKRKFEMENMSPETRAKFEEFKKNFKTIKDLSKEIEKKPQLLLKEWNKKNVTIRTIEELNAINEKIRREIKAKSYMKEPWTPKIETVNDLWNAIKSQKDFVKKEIFPSLEKWSSLSKQEFIDKIKKSNLSENETLKIFWSKNIDEAYDEYLKLYNKGKSLNRLSFENTYVHEKPISLDDLIKRRNKSISDIFNKKSIKNENPIPENKRLTTIIEKDWKIIPTETTWQLKDKIRRANKIIKNERSSSTDIYNAIWMKRKALELLKEQWWKHVTFKNSWLNNLK